MFPILTIQASGSPAQQAATGKKLSKTLSIIGYFNRLKKKQIPHEKPSDVAETKSDKTIFRLSGRSMAKLSNEVATKNAFECLDDLCLSDRSFVAADVNHEEKRYIGLDEACRKRRAHDIEKQPFVKPCKVVRYKEESTCVARAACQTCESSNIQTDDDTPEAKQIESVPRRLVAKMAANKKSRFVYSRLLNYLRCKHFMHIRDHHFITTLVSDARAWLLKNNTNMEQPLTFAILASAVTQAFMVNQEELDFRARIKNPIHLDHIEHLNATMSGDLGRVSIFKGKGLTKTLAATARRPLTRAVRISARPSNLI